MSAIEVRRAEIEALHREQDRELAARYNAPDLLSLQVPTSEWMQLREQQRLVWVGFVEWRDGVTPVQHRSGPTKSEHLLEFVKSNVGQVYTVKALAQAAECSESTVHKVISDHPHHFRKGMFAGTYEFLDPDVERAREAEGDAAPADSSREPRKPPTRTQPAGDPFAALMGGTTQPKEQP